MDRLIDICAGHMAKDGFTEEQARACMRQLLAGLDHWKKRGELHNNGRSEAFPRKSETGIDPGIKGTQQ